MSEIIDGYVADVMKGKINISIPISITADDVMGKYINATNCPYCKHHINANQNGDYYCPICDLSFTISPAADVVEAKYGYWKCLNNDPVNHPMDLLCSECHYISYMRTDFCPHCGANMKGWEENK